jgi:hypothetical protein
MSAEAFLRAMQCDVAAQHSTRQYDIDVNEYFSFHFAARIIG